MSKHKELFNSKDNTFSSQWGTIRTKALQSANKEALETALFSEENGKEGFLLKGQSSLKWNEKGRLQKLKLFINRLDESIALRTVVNLSSEMAKLCQKKGGEQ